jgi:hypothetical protein
MWTREIQKACIEKEDIQLGFEQKQQKISDYLTEIEFSSSRKRQVQAKKGRKNVKGKKWARLVCDQT